MKLRKVNRLLKLSFGKLLVLKGKSNFEENSHKAQIDSAKHITLVLMSDQLITLYLKKRYHKCKLESMWILAWTLTWTAKNLLEYEIEPHTRNEGYVAWFTQTISTNPDQKSLTASKLTSKPAIPTVATSSKLLRGYILKFYLSNYSTLQWKKLDSQGQKSY